MAISVYCEQCQETYKVKNELVGKRCKCKNGHALMIPNADGVAAAPPTAATDPSPAKPKPSKTAAKQKKCPSCKAALAPQAVLCVACGFDLRTGSKVGSTPASKANLPLVLLLAGGVAAVLVVIAVGAALFFLWPRGSETQVAQKDAKPNLLPGGGGKPNPPVGQDMHYTVQGDLVLIHNTPWGQRTHKMDFPTGSSGSTVTLYVGDKFEPRIRLVYDRSGVSSVTVDGKAIPRRN